MMFTTYDTVSLALIPWLFIIVISFGISVVRTLITTFRLFITVVIFAITSIWVSVLFSLGISPLFINWTLLGTVFHDLIAAKRITLSVLAMIIIISLGVLGVTSIVVSCVSRCVSRWWLATIRPVIIFAWIVIRLIAPRRSLILPL